MFQNMYVFKILFKTSAKLKTSTVYVDGPSRLKERLRARHALLAERAAARTLDGHLRKAVLSKARKRAFCSLLVLLRLVAFVRVWFFV